jgi:GTPase
MTSILDPKEDTLTADQSLQKRCGYIALLGRPNAGKSTLLNALLKTKLAVVSAKPQTTRNKILGVYTEGQNQALFLDTPGIHKADKLHKINKTMNKVAWSVLGDADIVCYLIDVEFGWHEEDFNYLQGILQRSNKPVVVIASRVDAVKKDKVKDSMESIHDGINTVLATLTEERLAFVEPLLKKPFPFPLSSKRPEFVESFRMELMHQLPHGDWLFEADDITNLPQRFICGEMIREQLFRQLGAEVPYSVGVKVETFDQKEAKPGFEPLVSMQATIIVQRDSHKGMVIGKGGSRLKSIGMASRESLERHLGQKVFLELFVRVQEGWIENDRLIAEYASLEIPE